MSEQPEELENPQPDDAVKRAQEPASEPITKPAPAPSTPAKSAPAKKQEAWKPTTGNLVLWIVVGGIGLYLLVSGVIGALNA